MLRLGKAAGAALRCSGAQSRYYSDATKTITATLFPGDGIGPEIAEATKQVPIRATPPALYHACPGSRPCTSGASFLQDDEGCIDASVVSLQVFHAAGAPIEWDEQYVGKEVDPRTNSFVTRENLDSVLVRPSAGPQPKLQLQQPRFASSIESYTLTCLNVMLAEAQNRAEGADDDAHRQRLPVTEPDAQEGAYALACSFPQHHAAAARKALLAPQPEGRGWAHIRCSEPRGNSSGRRDTLAIVNSQRAECCHHLLAVSFSDDAQHVII